MRLHQRDTGFTSPSIHGFNAYCGLSREAGRRPDDRVLCPLIAHLVADAQDRSRHAAGVAGEGLRIAKRRLVKDCFSMRATVPNVWLPRAHPTPCRTRSIRGINMSAGIGM
jgi:hypothetical protein